MNMKLKPEKYLKYLYLPNIFGAQRTKEILSINPTVIPQREEATEVTVHIFSYNSTTLEEEKLDSVSEACNFSADGRINWINIDGLRKADVEAVSNRFAIHPLLVEDILSINQRPKTDDVEGLMFCLLNMLYYNDENNTVETEQISIVLGKDFVISFQEDASRDVFNPLRDRLKFITSKARQRGADYLCYSMLDLIVDNYFLVMEKLGERIELMEEEIIRNSNKRSLSG